MVSRISNTGINCTNAFELSEWWKAVLNYSDVAGEPNNPGDAECVIVDPDTGHELAFTEVNELQDPEGRIHFDLVPTDRCRDEEISRVLGLGATQVADRRNPDGTGWMVLADPDGNLFCIVRSDEERTQSR
ncbi:MAG: VOC family protein [Acidimicrobiia bacterium]